MDAVTSGREGQVDELRRREALAQDMGGEERVARQRAAGRWTVRERIAALLDPGSWRETGSLAGLATYDDAGNLSEFVHSTMVIGQGAVDGRGVVVQADDFTVKGGAGGDMVWRQMAWAERAAYELRRPLMRLVDGTGGGGSVKTLESAGYAAFPSLAGADLMVANMSRVPVLAAALGPCAGLGAARIVLSHFSVIVKGTAQMFVAGPPVVAWAMNETPDKEELGGARTQLRAGAVDNEAVDEEDALAQMKRYLSYMPDSVWEAPPIVAGTDPPDRREQELLDIVPLQERRTYKMRRILELVFDHGSVFELGRRFGPSVITALARLDGRPVGVLASDPTHYGGGMTASGAEKTMRFVDTCDQFRLPVVNLVDQPGFVVGTESEKAGTMRRGARMIAAVQQARVPWCSIIVRKCFGVAGAAHGNGFRLNLRYAWPSGSWGSLPIAGGLEAAYRRELEAADDPVALREEIEARLRAVVSPFRTAEQFSIEHLIDPRDTRRLLCEWAVRAHELVGQDIGREEPVRLRGLRP
jgi:acetyl-CoA carboxylase carboxyltransferase component